MDSEIMQRLLTAISLYSNDEQQMIKINYQTGAQFEGNVIDCKRVGRGTFMWPNGSKYEGEYSENLRNGEGTQVWSDGSTYTGCFINDMRHGQGCMQWSNIETYEGTFFKDRRHGKGTYKWADGSSYSGTFYMDKKEGFGAFYFSNGDIFEGLYLEGEREGPGVVTYKNGKQDVGLWRGEKLVKLCSEIKGAFNVRSYPEFEFKQEEHILYINLNDDDNKFLAPIESILNPPSVLDYPPKSDLIHRLNEIYSESLHPKSLAIDSQTLDKEFFKDMPDKTECSNKLVAWNSTPDMVALQKHYTKHMFRKREVEINIDAVANLDRSGFQESGLLEQQSEELITAAADGDAEKVEMLLNSGKVHPDVSDCHGNTALIGASVNWRISVINILLNHGANVNKVNDDGCSALSTAAAFYYPAQGFVYNIAERYMKATSEVTTTNVMQESQHSGILTRKKERKISQLNQINRKKSEFGKNKHKKCESNRSITESGVSVKKTESRLEIYPERLSSTTSSTDQDHNVSEKVVDVRNDADVDSTYGGDAEDRVGEFENTEDEDDPEDFESNQSMRNYHIEVTDQLIERCATQLNQNVFVVNRDVSELNEMEKARTLAMQMYRREKMRETLNLLLKRGADPNISSVPLAVLFLAIKSADVDMVRLLLMKGANTNARLNSEKGGLYPIHIACALPGEEGVQITELLLNALADPNARADEDDSFLYTLLEEEWSKDIIPEESKALLGGRTALHIACARDDNYKNACNVARLLLEHKADTTLLCNGFSPLALAIASGNDLIVDELLTFGADPSQPLTHGVGSALCVATSTQYEDRRTIQGRLQLIDKLMKAGTNALAMIPIGSKRIMGTAVDYAYYMFNQDRRIAHIPYHALTHTERETYNARRKLLAHVGDIIRVKAVEREKRRNLAEEVDGLRSQSSSANFLFIGAGAKLPPGFKSKSASKGSHSQVKFESSDKEMEMKLAVRPLSAERSGIATEEGVDATKFKRLTHGRTKIKTQIRKPLFKYCYECGRSVGVRLTACTRCKEVYYCSNSCKLKAWNTRHKDECIRIGHSRSPSPKSRTLSPTSAILVSKGKNIASSHQLNVKGLNSAGKGRKQQSHKFRTGSPPNYEYVYIDNYSHN